MYFIVTIFAIALIRVIAHDKTIYRVKQLNIRGKINVKKQILLIKTI